MSDQTDFPEIYKQLKSFFQPALDTAQIEVDKEGSYVVNGLYSERFKRVMYLGGVTIRKNYVSFYLMPVYVYPELLEMISPQLKKRMQGKSCFNFKSLEAGLMKELQDLTLKGIQRFQKEGLL